MSKDGTSGLARIKDNGGLVIVQDSSTAEGCVTPKSAVVSVNIVHVLALEDIGTFLSGLHMKAKGIEV
jgi:chemotaxis response regulator CheB